MDLQRPTSDPSGAPSSSDEIAANDCSPRLLLELEPRVRGLLTSIGALLQRVQTPDDASCWPDVFVKQGLPGGGLARSMIVHVLLIAGIYGTSKMPRARIQIIEPYPAHQTITYYRVADQLPSLYADTASAPEAHAADPLPARQTVMSLPATPEKFRQRIIAPGAARLTAERPLPNIVAWNPTLPAPPVTGAEKFGRDIQLDRSASVVAPVPEDVKRALGIMNIHARVVVPPAPKDVNGWNPVDVPTPVAIAPAAIDSARKLSYDKLVALRPSAIAPPASDTVMDLGAKRLGFPQPLAVQPAPADARAANHESLLLPERAAIPPAAHDTGTTLSGGKAGDFSLVTRTAGAPASLAPSPTPGRAASTTGPEHASGQLLVFGLNPAQPDGAIEVPSGNLSGSFGSSPDGKVGASGTPEQVPGGHGAGGGRKSSDDGLSGVSIAGNSVPAEIPTVAVSASAPSEDVPHARLLPPIRHASVAELASGGGTILPQSQAEDHVFHSRRAYSMALNTPNLTSVAGSWIIHFAELAGPTVPVSASHLIPPTIVMKADPAYPSELMRQGVQGTVRLYAVIHADGSVGDVRILEGVDSRLDHNAEIALSECRFRPATRDGSGVEIEAVVEIPFRSQALR